MTDPASGGGSDDIGKGRQAHSGAEHVRNRAVKVGETGEQRPEPDAESEQGRATRVLSPQAPGRSLAAHGEGSTPPGPVRWRRQGWDVVCTFRIAAVMPPVLGLVKLLAV